MANIARPTKIWDQTLNDWVFLAGVVDTTKSYTYTADQTFPGITATSINGGSISGKNYVINGNFDIWQRGSSFSMTNGFGPDRFLFDGHGTTLAVARSTDVPNANSKYSLQVGMTSYNSSDLLFRHHIEKPTNLYGQLTISFWAKTTSGTVKINADVNDISTSDFTLTTAWQKFTGIIGSPTNIWDANYPSNLHTFLDISIANASLPYTGTILVSQIKLEMGTQATQFCTAGANVQQELAMCQRYYWRNTAQQNYSLFATGMANSSTNVQFHLKHPVEMRTAPTTIDYSTLQSNDTVTGVAISFMAYQANESGTLASTVNASTTGMTQYRLCKLLASGSTSAYIGFGAEF